MKIVFLLQGEGTLPCGGPKVVYEYANALVRRGHSVSVVHPAILSTDNTALYLVKRAIRYAQRAIDRSYRPDAWFTIDDRVELLWKPSLDAHHIPDADVVVATWWLTAESAANYPPSKGEKFYLIQSLETWGGPEERVMATWHLPFRKIVIARWLRQIAMDMNEEATYIPNGLDFRAFGIDVDPQERSAHRVMMLYHEFDRKGSADGLTALRLAREHVTSIQADIFGISSAPRNLPDWIRYHRNPPQSTLRKLYNQASIFIAPSWSEGWGLTASEALQCGCALIATDIGGHREFCIDDGTALLNPPRDTSALARNVVSLLEDPERRIRLARSGNEYIQQFTWDRAADAFEAALIASLTARQKVPG